MLRELLKAYCVTDNAEKAFKLINTAEAKYPGLTLTGTVFEPVLYYYACVAKTDQTAEVIQLMETMNVAPTPACIDPIVISFIERGDGRQALSYIQNMFTAHKVRPTVPGIIRLLDAALAAQDESLAREIAGTIAKLFTNTERLHAYAPRQITYLTDTHSGANASAALPATEEEEEDDEDTAASERAARKEAAAVGEYDPSNRKDLENSSSWIDTNVSWTAATKIGTNITDVAFKSAHRKAVAAAVANERAPTRHLTVPLPRMRGSLSDKHLQARFKAYGLSWEE